MIEYLGYRLTERDYEILRYLAEMDFAGYDSLHSLFFAHCKCKKKPIKVLSKLLREGFVSKRLLDDGKRFFSLRSKGLNAVRYKYPQRNYLELPKGVSFKHIYHSVSLSYYRSVMEKRFDITRWKSDRLLAHEEGLYNRHSTHIPDAIFYSDYENYILEYERTLKSKHRIKEKVKSMNHKIRTEGLKQGFILCENKKIYLEYKEANYTSKIQILLCENLKYWRPNETRKEISQK